MKKFTFLSLFLITVAAYGQELISDGSFESSSGTPNASSSPWKAAGSTSLDIPNNPSLANTGDKSLRFFVSSDQIFVYQDITAEANTTYTLSLSYFVSAIETESGERPLISIRKGDYPSNSFLVANTPLDLSTTAGSYIDYNLTFTTDTETNLEFYITRRITDKQLRFDDISIRKT